MPMSQNDIGNQSNFLTPRKYEQIDLSDDAVHNLSPPVLSADVSFILVIEAEDSGIRYRDDGTSPTLTVGQPIAKNASMTLAIVDVTAIELITNTSGSGKANVNYYTYQTLQEVS